MRHLKIIFLLLILSLSSSSCAVYHHYGPYYGKVVDAETKQPLEGVVVFAKYNTWLHASPGGPATYFLDAQEVVTGKNGEFRMPSVNAFAFRPLSTFNPEPNFKIFKPRYKCYANRLTENQDIVIELQSLKSRNERIESVDACYPTSVPDSRMKKLIESTNMENVELGFGPRPTGKE